MTDQPLTAQGRDVRTKLEDLKVLKRSPDLLNNVKISQGQLRLNIFCFTIYGHGGHFGQMT